MKIRTLVFAVAGILAAALVASATPNGNPFTRGSKFRQTPKLRDNTIPKMGHRNDGRYPHWSRSNENDYSGTWSDDQGWLAPPSTMAAADLNTLRADVHQAAGDIQSGDVPPINWNGVIYVSCRDYFNAANTTAYWDQKNSSATAKLPDGRTVVLPLSQGVAKIDGKPAAMAHPSVPVNDVMMVPLRDLSDALGFSIQWDPDRKQAFLIPTGPAPAAAAGAGPAEPAPDK